MKRAILFLALFACLSTGFSTFLYLELRRLKTHVADLEMEAKLRQVENDLKVPSEAIYYDGPAMRQIAEIRQAVYEANGVEWFVPYKNVYYGKTMVWSTSEDGETKAAIPASNWTSIVNGSIENFWLNHAHQVCSSLAFEIENDLRLGNYLNNHPEVFEQRVRPAVVRLLNCKHDKPRFEACKTLIVAGDRSEAVMQVLADFIREPDLDLQMPVNGQSTVVKRPSSAKRGAIDLNETYNLGLES